MAIGLARKSVEKEACVARSAGQLRFRLVGRSDETCLWRHPGPCAHPQ